MIESVHENYNIFYDASTFFAEKFFADYFVFIIIFVSLLIWFPCGALIVYNVFLGFPPIFRVILLFLGPKTSWANAAEEQGGGGVRSFYY